jgi:hypothetical protein
MVAYQASLKMS